MLELVKMKRINIYQQEMMGPIWLYRSDCDESVLPLGRGVATPQFDRPDAVDVPSPEPMPAALAE